MADPKDFQFDLPARRWEDPPGLDEKIHRRAWNAAPRCTSSRGASADEMIELMIIHATAGSSTEGAVSVMEAGRASFHWIVPDENEAAHGKFVWACASERRAAWHVRRLCAHPDICGGARGLNQRSLGIEIVNAQSGGDRFSPWQVEVTAQIVRYAWAKYPNLKHVASHARLDPERRTDPGANFPWTDFQALALGDQDRLRATMSV